MTLDCDGEDEEVTAEGGVKLVVVEIVVGRTGNGEEGGDVEMPGIEQLLGKVPSVASLASVAPKMSLLAL